MTDHAHSGTLAGCISCRLEEQREEIYLNLCLRLDDHHCCRWGEKPDEHPTGKLRGYCGYEMTHGFGIENLKEMLREILIPKE